MNLQPILISSINQRRPLIIAGPCSAETEIQVMTTAHELKKGGIKIFRAGIWKPRTKPGGFEGVGEKGLIWLQKARKEANMYVATEVANRVHVLESVNHEIDILWIGARTSANPFAVQEVADALKMSGFKGTVLIKNPVNPDLELWIGAIERIYNAGIQKIGVIHRGFTSYDKSLYRNLPQWHIPIELKRRIPNLPIFADPSHIGGKRELVASISQQAMDLNYYGLIIESHYNPDEAWSDKDQQISPEVLFYIINLLVIRETKQTTESLTDLRRQIDDLDNDLLSILAKRMRISKEIGQYKKEHNMPVLQTNRYDEILKNLIFQAKGMGMDPIFLKNILESIHEESIRQQMDIINH